MVVTLLKCIAIVIAWNAFGNMLLPSVSIWEITRCEGLWQGGWGVYGVSRRKGRIVGTGPAVVPD